MGSIAGKAGCTQVASSQLDPARLGYPLPVPPERVVADEDVTDLAVLVEAIGKAAQILGIPAQPSPWLPPLPEHLVIDDLLEPAPAGKLAPVAYGLDDLPAGPALLVTEVLTKPASRWRPWDKLAIKNLIYTVFPPGSSEALQLAFSTTRAGVLDEALQLDADATIDTLTVSLGQVHST